MAAGTNIVIGAFTVSGVVHLVSPQLFEPLIPPRFGDPTPWVLGSGAVELACAAGLATRQKWAPVAAAATLAVIWVGNAQMALDVQRSSRPVWQKALVWGRLPLQIPMIRAALASPTR